MKSYLEYQNTLLKRLQVDPENGLKSNPEVQVKREQFGKNELTPPPKDSLGKRILNTLKDVATIILLFAAVVSFGTAIYEGSGEYVEGLLIIGIVIINSILSIVQEGKAEKALSALQALNQAQVKVLRNGKTLNLSTSEIVVGDILQLVNGEKIPADARLLSSHDLQVEEAPLTGESLPIEKDANQTFTEEQALGDRRNMVFSGTSIVNGGGKAVVTAVGDNTELGRIASFLKNEKKQLTPLQMKLKQLGQRIALIAILSAIAVLIIGWLHGMDFLHVFMVAISLAVAVVPETLTVIVTMTLAVGVRKMADRHAIIRRLPAVETLGTTSVIASDKTGTLTQNKMTVQRIWSAVDNQVFKLDDKYQPTNTMQSLMLMAGLSTNVHRSNETEEIEGLPTEVALVNAMETVQKLETVTAAYPRIKELPFNSTRKRMTTVQRTADGDYLVITKGAIDVLKPLISNGDLARAAEVTHEFGEKALRVLAVTMKRMPAIPLELITEEQLENDLTLIGLFGIVDPPRPESADAVAAAKKAGVRTVMITGDHVVTATAIAKEIGILNLGERAISGSELHAMSDEELEATVEQYSVYARVTPADKIRIVKAWQKRDAVVAMTGDGVNDAPALKAADVGIAMGQTGTDVAREAADIVLTDDNFASIVSAISQGRGSYDRIKKTINFLLSSNMAELIMILLALAVGWGTPLLPIHILFVNLVANGLPGFALSYEINDPANMKKAPLPKQARLFGEGLAGRIAFNAGMFAFVSLIAFLLGSNLEIGGMAPSETVGQTFAFAVLSIVSVIHVFNIRSDRSLFSHTYRENPRLVQMALLSIALSIIVIVIAPIAHAFGLTPLTFEHWAYVAGFAFVPTILMEIVKFTHKQRARILVEEVED